MVPTHRGRGLGARQSGATPLENNLLMLMESHRGLPPFGAATPLLGVCPTDITRKKRVFADCPRTCHPVIYHHTALV